MDHPRPLRPFFVLWTAQAISLLGSNAVQFALIWWLTERTGSASILALATFLGIVPQVVLGPLLGAWVDRWNRKRIMLFADAAIAAASAVLAVLFLTGQAGTPAVLALLFARALCGALHAPAMLASTSLMVPTEHLARIQGLNQSVQGGQLIISAPLGALLYAALPMAGVMGVDILTAAIAIVPLLFIHVPQPPREAGSDVASTSTVREILDGMAYLRSRRGHLTLLGIGSVINLFMIPAFSLLPLLVLQYGKGALHLGGMNSLFGVGTIVGGVTLGVWGGFKRQIHTTLVGLIAMGLMTLVLGAAPSFAVAVVAVALLGVGVPLANGPIMAVLQATVAPEIQGRIFSLYASVCGLAAPLGLVAAAPVAEALGVRVWYFAGGAVCVALGTLGFFLPSLAELERTSGDTDRDIALAS